jgi:hypothetical protein
MCRSVDALAPATSDHVIIVDRADPPKFRELEPGRRRTVDTEVSPRRRLWKLEGTPRRAPLERVTWVTPTRMLRPAT